MSKKKDDMYLCANEIKHTIPPERYGEVKIGIGNASNCCYLIFERNIGLLSRAESIEKGNK